MVLHQSPKTPKNKTDLFSVYMQNVMIDFDNELEINKLKQASLEDKKLKKKPGSKL